MTRDHVGELLSPYIDDRVSPEERDRIARHLEACEGCRQDLAALQGVVGLLRSTPPVAAPESLRGAVRVRVEAVNRTPAWRWPLPAWVHRIRLPALRWRPIAAAAAVVLMGVFAANLVAQFAHLPGGVPRDHSRGREIEEHSFDNAYAPKGAATEVPAAPSVVNRQVAVPAPGGAQTTDGIFRSVIRTAHLAVEVEHFDAGARRLLDIAEGAGGFVADSSYSDDGGRPRAEFTLRVPAARFSAVVKDVEGMGTVRQRQISAQDVTEDFVDLQARQRNLERHEQQLLAFMDRATKVSDLLTIEQELARVRGQIEQTTGRLRYLAHNVEMASVAAALTERAKNSGALWDFGATLEKMQTAFLATIRQILTVGERAAVLASTLLPVAAIAAAVWAVIRRTRRAGAGA